MARTSTNLILKMLSSWGSCRRSLYGAISQFVSLGEISTVFHLRKSLYGLKQNSRAWFDEFSEVIEKFGIQKSKSYHSVFYRNSQAGIILLVVYVDDFVMTGNDMAGILSLNSFLHGQFHTKDLGMLKYFVGVEVIRSKHRIFLSQRKYVLDLLSETGKLAAKLIPLWHIAYNLLERGSCLKTLRDIEAGWEVELPYNNTP